MFFDFVTKNEHACLGPTISLWIEKVLEGAVGHDDSRGGEFFVTKTEQAPSFSGLSSTREGIKPFKVDLGQAESSKIPQAFARRLRRRGGALEIL